MEDVQTAIKKLKVLGTGFALLGTGKNQMVQSVPGELNLDHTSLLELAQLVRDFFSDLLLHFLNF